MAGNDRQLAIGELAVDDMQVGAAYTACKHRESISAAAMAAAASFSEAQAVMRRFNTIARMAIF